MPAVPPTRPLLAAAAALLAGVSACAGAGIPAGPDALAGGSARAEAAQAAHAAQVARAAQQQADDARAAARDRSEKDRATRSRARTAADARAARAQAAARAKAARIAKAKADARAKAARAKAAKEQAASRSKPRTSARAAAAAPARTSWPALNRAIAAIPGYRDGIARWHVTSKGHYGLTDANQPGAANIYISPSVPSNLLYSVVAHEYGHAVVIANYGTGYGPYTQYSRDMVNWFGGDKVTGLERAADCMARQLGATWTNYTSCSDSHWRKGANILLGGGRL